MDNIEQVQIKVPELQKRSAKPYYTILVICLAIVIAVTITLIVTGGGPAPKKPHILLIVADDMGYNDIGYYNKHDDIRTPFLDYLSQQGMRLDTYYAQSVCTPSRAALTTGRYPFRFGMQGARPILHGSTKGMPTDEILLPEMLKTGGYVTYLVGKWHLGYADWAMTPTRRGFDYFCGMYGGSADYFSHKSTLNGFDMVEEVPTVTDKSGVKHKTLLETAGKFSELLFTQKAVSIIDEHDTKDPMFLMLAYMNPHSPLEALESDLKRASHVQNEIRRNFTALMSSLDYGVEEVVMSLKRKGIFEESVIIFTGDNGGAVAGRDRSSSLGGTNFPFRGAKWTIWEGGVRVPAFVVGPGIKAGTKSDGLFHITDWFPTIAKLADIKLGDDAKLDGVDQTVLLLNDGPSARTDVILELDMARKQAAIRSGNFKLIVGKAGAKPLNGVYAPLTGNDTTYQFENNDWGEYFYKNVSVKAAEMAVSYVRDYPSYYKNFSHIGNFTYEDVSLYDISSDLDESYDLFTSDGRFHDKARELYDRLVEEARDMAHPIIFFPPFMDQKAALKMSSDGVTQEWTPFL